MERYNNLKAKYNELEGEHERLKVVARQKEKDLEGIKKVNALLFFLTLHLNSKKLNASKIVDRCFAGRTKSSSGRS